ncbi:MAG TPA: ABC transporter permease [Candidatus Bathyarchaeia archaeon]|nr:ABC transporter permease [Candidatus Bathyarchaeia archaeon]
MNRPFFNLVALQFKEFFREPEIIFWAFLLPIILSWLLGIAIGSGGGGVSSTVAVIESREAPREYWTGWIERAQTAYANAGRRVGFVMLARDGAILALKKGEISLFIEKASAADSIRYFFDPRSGEAQMTYLSLERSLRAPAGEERSAVVPLRIQGTRYVDFLVPGLLAMDVMSSALWGIGWALIEIRIKKLLRRMAATPMHKSMFLCSHFVTRLIVNAIEFLALFVFVYFYFGVRIQGNVGALVMIFVAGNMAFAGLSILMSSRTANPRVGNGLINAITFPMTLLSGVFFSYHHFPQWAIPVVRILPLTMLADSIRSIFNEGAGLAQVALPAFVLAALGAVFFSIGMKVYKWY